MTELRAFSILQPVTFGDILFLISVSFLFTFHWPRIHTHLLTLYSHFIVSSSFDLGWTAATTDTATSAATNATSKRIPPGWGKGESSIRLSRSVIVDDRTRWLSEASRRHRAHRRSVGRAGERASRRKHRLVEWEADKEESKQKLCKKRKWHYWKFANCRSTGQWNYGLVHQPNFKCKHTDVNEPSTGSFSLLNYTV